MDTVTRVQTRTKLFAFHIAKGMYQTILPPAMGNLSGRLGSLI